MGWRELPIEQRTQFYLGLGP